MLPTNIIEGRAAIGFTGCALALWAADPTYRIEIQRAPDSGGSPGSPATIDIVDGTTQVYMDELPEGDDQYHYRIRHTKPGYNDSGWTPYVAITPVEFIRATRPAYVAPSMDEQPSDDGATGTLDLILTDPQNRVVTIKGKSRSGNGSEEGSWQTLSLASGSYTDTVDLAQKHPSTVRYQVNSYDDRGVTVTRERTVPFPLASKPAKPLVTLALALNGDVTAHVEGDSDTVNIRAAGATDAYPSAGTVDAEDPDAGNSIDTGVLVNIDQNETAYISVRAYDSTPTGSDLAKAKLTGISEELNDPPDAITAVVLDVVVDVLEVELLP